MKKAVKGTYGYIKTKRTFVLLRTILYFVISLALLFAGIISTGSRKNLLTVVAVLGCLPAAKSLVNYVMFCRAKGCSEAVKEQAEAVTGDLVGMFDMYFTSYKKNFAISHMVVDGKTICGLTEDDKCNLQACETHLADMLKQGGFKDMTIKIFRDTGKYCDRLVSLNKSEHGKTPERDDEIRVILYDISL
ncbi:MULTISPECIES: hypothetical protein [Suilimivivens]|jgi:hypothetical protein|uniref:Uncharacterized protein n=1 Tax=Suilimivivens aceti TaxID=2981774 RepID=A0ABT2SZG5_9FIRM|nr:hypothetical protein [Suilimivivens aceti]MCU6743387.1 hypothetical protein [Suilimivivens aceti]SCH17164.1 Uncharacterised protein [uncultured Clostridium sp.]